MKKPIDLPVKLLSNLKRVHLSLDMNGKHYQDLATFDGEQPEQILLSILSDLIDENADLLTKQECCYLFTIVKISNLGSKIPIRLECPSCKHTFKDVLNLANVHINEPSKDWKIPKVSLPLIDDEPIEYSVLPPTLASEIRLLDWLSVYKDITRKSIYEDKDKTVMYKMYFAMLHLVDKNGNRIFDDVDSFNTMDEKMGNITYKQIAHLVYLSEEVDSFGISPNVKFVECEECGEKLSFHFPILYGLCSEHTAH